MTRITGGTVASTLAPPLLRINTTLLSEAQAQCVNTPDPNCQEDCCTLRDNCENADTIGHYCETKDLCGTDESGNCFSNQCVFPIHYQTLCGPQMIWLPLMIR